MDREAGRAGSRTAGEKSYVRTIERRFNALRDSGLYVSPKDFALLLDWHERGVPAELVIHAIEEVFRKAAARGGGKKISSIVYCRRAVEAAWEERRAALLGSAPPANGPGRGAFTVEEVLAHLAAAAEATEAAARHLALQPAEGGAREPSHALAGVAARIRELRAALEAPGAPELQALEAELVALEERAVGIARTALGGSEEESLAQSAEDSIAAFSPRMSERAKAATLRRAIEGAIRRRFGLPRYSLFAMIR